MIRVESTRFGSRLEVAILKEEMGGRLLSAVNKLIWQKIDEGELIPRVMHISPGDAQVLMDDLWSCGIRPTEGRGSAGQLQAVERHLEDMRKIAADKLKVSL